MARGTIDFIFYASDDAGNKLKIRFGGLGDPGCILTAVFMVETSLVLAKDHASLPVVGAGLLPGTAIGQEKLIPRLLDSGRVMIEELN